MSSFQGKHILITGGGSGIGRTMAQHICSLNPAVITLWDINEQSLTEAKSELTGEHHIRTQVVDIADPEQIYAQGQRALKSIGPVDILINNAGIVVGKSFSEHSREDIEQTMRINLLGAMHVCRCFLPAMQQQKSGHIVNIASASGLIPNPNMTVYASSKWGMIGWSESMRVEFEQHNENIRVTTIQPSYINTGMFEGVTAPRLTPFLEPDDIVSRIINAVQENKIQLRAPFMVKLIPFLKGILPRRLFDIVAGKLFMVYRSMDTFKGHNSST
jgi:short-subunit dehydrogenase